MNGRHRGCAAAAGIPLALCACGGRSLCILVHPCASLCILVHPCACGVHPCASLCMRRASLCMRRASLCILVHPCASLCILVHAACILVHAACILVHAAADPLPPTFFAVWLHALCVPHAACAPWGTQIRPARAPPRGVAIAPHRRHPCRPSSSALCEFLCTLSAQCQHVAYSVSM